MRQRRLMNQINVVPYIDVMLVLLVIFMVTAPMIQPGSIDVPSAGSLPAPKADAAVIEIKADGKIALSPNGTSAARPVTAIEFQRALKDAIAANPEQPFVVRADKAIQYQKVIDVLETARGLGVRKISLQTQSGSQGR